jgi:hypothetical protein
VGIGQISQWTIIIESTTFHNKWHYLLNYLHSGDEMERAKDERGERYWLQALVHRHYSNQKWSGHRARQEPRMEWWTSNDKETRLF